MERGVTTFLPKREVWSRRRDRRQKVKIPLFPGYLFVGSVQEEFQAIYVLRTKGVVRLLGMGGEPVPVPRSQVESLRLMTASGESLHPLQRLVNGSRVRVVEGPLAGVEGVVLHTRQGERLVVSVELLHRSVAVSLHESEVEKIAAPDRRVLAGCWAQALPSPARAARGVLLA